MVALKKVSGKSLVEILIALVIISSVMMVFSTVFLQVSKPSLYKVQIEHEQVYLYYYKALLEYSEPEQSFQFNNHFWETKATTIEENLYSVDFFVDNKLAFSKRLYRE